MRHASAQPTPSRLETAWRLGCVAAIVALTCALVVTVIGPWAVGGKSLVVETSSMHPSIDAGDLAVLKPIDEVADLQTGDVVTYQTALADASGRSVDQLVTHRVVGFGARDGQVMVTTRGDANNVTDDPVPFDDIRGELWYVVPKAGYATAWIQRNSRLLLGGAVALLVASALVDYVRTRRAASPQADRTTDAEPHAEPQTEPSPHAIPETDLPPNAIPLGDFPAHVPPPGPPAPDCLTSAAPIARHRAPDFAGYPSLPDRGVT